MISEVSKYWGWEASVYDKSIHDEFRDQNGIATWKNFFEKFCWRAYLRMVGHRACYERHEFAFLVGF